MACWHCMVCSRRKALYGPCICRHAHARVPKLWPAHCARRLRRSWQHCSATARAARRLTQTGWQQFLTRFVRLWPLQ